VAASITVCLIGCAQKTLTLRPSELVGLKNPSIHILADRTKEVPVTGTFGWGYCLFRIDPSPENQLGAIAERLQRAMLASLTGKGLTYSETEPDLLVSYALASDAAIDDCDLDKAYTALLKMPPAEASETSLHYKRGVLILDIVDRKEKHLLWRGAILAEIDLSWAEERKQERCDAAISELLRHYPIP
jgi:hypothetical protein